jgi:hypothetical protein
MTYYQKRMLEGIYSYRTWLLVLCMFLAICSCDDEAQQEQELVIAKAATNRLTYFAFLAKQNPRYLDEDVVFDISDTTSHIISGRIPEYTRIDSLVATFQSNGVEVQVNRVKQQSDTTANDFSRPLTYVVLAENGLTSEYTIQVKVFTGLPVLTIETKDRAPIVSKDDYVKGTYVLDGVGILPNLSGILEIQGRGNSTFLLPKKPYQIKLDKKEAMLGPTFGKDKKWLLLANYTDKTMLRNETGFMLSRLSHLDFTPGSAFVEVFLNGSYDGTYQLTQKVEISENRVRVTDDGFLLEIDQLDRLGEDDVYFETSRHLFNIKEPDVDLNGANYNYIKDYVTQAEAALFGNDFMDPAIGYSKYLDIDSYIDWYLINEIAKNNDATFYSSCYMNLTPGGKLKMGPVWDFDIGFGNVNYNGNESPTGFWIKEQADWIGRLFEDPAFVAQVKERFKFFQSQKKSIVDKIRASEHTLRWSQGENNSRWATLGIYTWPNAVAFETYDEEVDYLDQWINVRIAWLSSAFSHLEE